MLASRPKCIFNGRVPGYESWTSLNHRRPGEGPEPASPATPAPRCPPTHQMNAVAPTIGQPSPAPRPATAARAHRPVGPQPARPPSTSAARCPANPPSNHGPSTLPPRWTPAVEERCTQHRPLQQRLRAITSIEDPAAAAAGRCPAWLTPSGECRQLRTECLRAWWRTGPNSAASWPPGRPQLPSSTEAAAAGGAAGVMAAYQRQAAAAAAASRAGSRTFTAQKLQAALRRLRRNNAADLDGLREELLKCGAGLDQPLLHLCNLYLASGSVPPELARAWVQPTPKAGAPATGAATAAPWSTTPATTSTHRSVTNCGSLCSPRLQSQCC